MRKLSSGTSCLFHCGLIHSLIIPGNHSSFNSVHKFFDTPPFKRCSLIPHPFFVGLI